MKTLIIVAGIALLCSCKNNRSGADLSTSVDSLASVTTPSAAEDTLKPNMGTWQAKVVSAKNKKGGKLTVSGNVNVVGSKAKVSLSQKLPVDASSNELVLVISKEPKEGKQQGVNVSFVQNVRDVNKYKKVSILYNNKQVAVINNIEQTK